MNFKEGLGAGTLIILLVATFGNTANAAQPRQYPSQTKAQIAAKTVASPMFHKPNTTVANRAPAEKILHVRGQNRNISMMLVLKDEKEKIKFGQFRESFREEVLKTSF